MQACVDGQISRNALQELPFAELPRGLREVAGGWKDARFFRATGLKDTHLFLLSDGGKLEPGLSNLCAVVVPYLPMRDTYASVSRQIGGPPPPPWSPGQFGFSHMNFERGYVFAVRPLVTTGWGGPYSSPYRMILTAQMKPEFAAKQKQLIAQKEAEAAAAQQKKQEH